MSLTTTVRRLIPQRWINALRQRTWPWRISRQISPYLPPVVCVDVGASYYPHVKWLTFLNGPRTQWLAVEPNDVNLGYVKSWSWPSQVHTCTVGLSQEGGEQTLFVTHVDSGSSLLPPEIPVAMQHRITNLDYFFPVTERRIQTLTLIQAMQHLSNTAPVFVKLDTQGTELSILQGAQALFNAQRIVGIEMESTMLAQPFMKGSGKFWQACQYLEAQGFELLHVKPIHAPRQSGRSKPVANTFLNECDAIFALRPDIAQQLPVEFRASLLGFYLTNSFFEEALSLLQRDTGVSAFLCDQGCQLEALVQDISTII